MLWFCGWFWFVGCHGWILRGCSGVSLSLFERCVGRGEVLEDVVLFELKFDKQPPWREAEGTMVRMCFDFAVLG